MGGGGGFRAVQADPAAVARQQEAARVAAEQAAAKKTSDFNAFQAAQRPGVRAFQQNKYEEKAGAQPLTLEGLRDVNTGQLLSQYRSDPYSGEAQQALKQQAFAQGDSPWAKMMLAKQRQEQLAGGDVAAKQGLQALSQGQSQLAMSGGLSAGARERMARGGSRDLMLAKQNIARQGIGDRLNIGSQDIDRKQSLLSDFANAENTAQQQNITRQTQDVGSLNDFNAQRYAENMKAWGAEQTANAQRQAAGSGGGCFVGSTLVFMADGSEKPINTIVLNDVLLGGGKVIGVVSYGGPFELYDYKGIKVTGSHAVQEHGEFVRVEDSKLGFKLGEVAPAVFNLITEKHLILSGGVVFGDDMETDEDFADDKSSIAAMNGASRTQ